MGRSAEASEILHSSQDLDLPVMILVLYLEAGMLARDQRTVQAIAPKLAPLARRLLGSGNHLPSPVCVARLLGGAAALAGNAAEAEGYYRQALEVCERVRHRPELALSHLELAELLLRGGSRDAEAISHLDVAIGELQEMKMQPALERALKHKGLLHA